MKTISITLCFLALVSCPITAQVNFGQVGPGVIGGDQPQLNLLPAVVQHFPARGPASEAKTKWRIHWGIVRHGQGSEVLYISSAWFQRSPQEPEIQVLGDCRLAEIFVPYNDGTRIHDISGYNFSLAPLSGGLLGPACVQPPRLFGRDGVESDTSGYVACEVHDDSLRYMRTDETGRRGEVITLWSALDGANYRYIMLYGFTDDGQIHFRLGATANNLMSFDANSTPEQRDAGTHLHMGVWRLNPVLGNRNTLSASIVELDTQLLRTVQTAVATEERFRWEADRFTRFRITSNSIFNAHQPPNPIAYEINPLVRGTGRYLGLNEDFTLYDFWVTRRRSGEDRPVDLPDYEGGESLVGVPIVLWHSAAVIHVPRDEDFGPVGYDRDEGVATTGWAGFDLKPKNFFRSTPF
jgi:hypothetical protein